jgi:DNA-binding MarR family transcriptional regulator
MSSPHRPAEKSGPPFVGALLRIPWQAVRARILADLAAAGFGDIAATHFPVLQYPPPEGVRPIDLADRAGISKQAMNYLIAQLEDRGYVERRQVPRRGRLVFLTPRGWQVAETIWATMRALEAEWAKAMGRARYQEFRAALVDLAALVTETPASPRS